MNVPHASNLSHTHTHTQRTKNPRGLSFNQSSVQENGLTFWNLRWKLENRGGITNANSPEVTSLLQRIFCCVSNYIVLCNVTDRNKNLCHTAVL